MRTALRRATGNLDPSASLPSSEALSPCARSGAVSTPTLGDVIGDLGTDMSTETVGDAILVSGRGEFWMGTQKMTLPRFLDQPAA